MATIDKLLEKMVLHEADRAVLLSNQPIRLFVGKNEMVGQALPAMQLRDMIKEITPVELRPELAYKSVFHFQHRSQNTVFYFEVTNEKSILQVTVTLQSAIPIADVDLDNLDFSFDSSPIDSLPLNMGSVTDHIETSKKPPIPQPKPTPTAQESVKADSFREIYASNIHPNSSVISPSVTPQPQQNAGVCWYCKMRAANDSEVIRMQRNSEQRSVIIPRCSTCSAKQKSSGVFYLGGGCLGSLISTIIFCTYVYPSLYNDANASNRFVTLIGMMFFFGPYILWFFAADDAKKHLQHPAYKEAQREGFTEVQSHSPSVSGG